MLQLGQPLSDGCGTISKSQTFSHPNRKWSLKRFSLLQSVRFFLPKCRFPRKAEICQSAGKEQMFTCHEIRSTDFCQFPVKFTPLCGYSEVVSDRVFFVSTLAIRTTTRPSQTCAARSAVPRRCGHDGYVVVHWQSVRAVPYHVVERLRPSSCDSSLVPVVTAILPNARRGSTGIRDAQRDII